MLRLHATMNHGRPTKAAPPEEGEAAEIVPADCAGGEGYRAEQADPEVETDDTVEASQSTFLSANSLSSAESKA